MTSIRVLHTASPSLEQGEHVVPGPRKGHADVPRARHAVCHPPARGGDRGNHGNRAITSNALVSKRS
jgi:hypothetical protein